MPKKVKNDSPTTNTDQNTNETPNVGSGDQAAQANPNAATDLDQAQANNLEESLDQQPNTVEDNLTPAQPTSEAEATAQEPTQTVPAGSADSTADHTADSPYNDTRNTHPQSPTHKGKLTEAQKKGVKEEMDKPGASANTVAEQYGITSERVFEIVDEINGVPEDERGLNKTGVTQYED